MRTADKNRRKTREVKIGNASIGGESPVLVQSMTNTRTTDIQKTISQISSLQEHGCEIVRISIPDMGSAEAVRQIRKKVSLPIVADIHFDYRLAVAVSPYVDKLRINPGNIGSGEKIKAVVEAASRNNIPIRIGVNLGSLEKDIESRYGLTAKAMVESARKHISILNRHGFDNIVVALKASDVQRTIEANELFSEEFDYPLHIGITESGSKDTGGIRSAIGIGHLLLNGIGDTIRVSLSDDPVEEVITAWKILKGAGLRRRGIDVTSCPTCARACFNVSEKVKDLEKLTSNILKPIHIAVMGCAVNGPGEAKSADIGVAGGPNDALLYVDGHLKKRIPHDRIVDEVMEEITENQNRR